MNGEWCPDGYRDVYGLADDYSCGPYQPTHFIKSFGMKKILIGLPMILIAIGILAHSKKYDTRAILIIDRMTDVIDDFEGDQRYVKVGETYYQPVCIAFAYF